MANPTVNAGLDQSANDNVPLVLVGTATQGTYEIKGSTWTMTSGPSCSISTPSQWVTEVFQLSAGSYVFTFSVYDIKGNNASDTCSITITHTTGPVYFEDFHHNENRFNSLGSGTTLTDDY